MLLVVSSATADEFVPRLGVDGDAPQQTAVAANPESDELARWVASRDARMAWWRDARFGMFIHFGLYSPAGGKWNGKVYEQHYAEWIQHWAAVSCAEYARQMKPLFLPVAGFAQEWAALAKDAGMGYAVMTAKHHDGFTLFNSKQPYSLENHVTGATNISPSGRDVAREFADAMREHGLRAGFYYSLLDWQHPDAYEMALPAYPPDARPRQHDNYVAYVRAHVNELLENYGPLSTIWFDYSDATHQGAAWGAANLMSDLRIKQPAIVVNNRLYLGLENRNGDYGTPEKYVPPTGLPGMDWEVNHTLNESYGFSAHDANWKDSATVVRLLCDVVSKGGNLLLNVGPDASGHVPQRAHEVLRDVGAWMRVNGEAIYGTTASPFARLAWGRATRKADALYLMVFDWPHDGRLLVPIRGKVKAARMLGGEGELTFSRGESEDSTLEVRVPTRMNHVACTVVRLDFDGPIEAMPLEVFTDGNGAIQLTPHDATLVGPSLRIEQIGAVEDVRYNLGYWMDTAATAAWPIGIKPSESGTYIVTANIACADAAAGSEVRLDIDEGSATVDFKVPATGGWQEYHSIELGRLTLSAGNHRVVLRALTKTGEAVVNVRSITLRQAIHLDLDQDSARQTVVDKELGVYLGHVSTVLLDDGKTILAAYPMGHGRGSIILKRSDDGGKTWSPRLSVPASWATSLETPTIFRVGRTERGESLILFSGLYPIRAARSQDSGATWSELEAIGDFGGIVAMGGLADLGDGKFAAFFHDDGRFIARDGKATGRFTLYQTDSANRGATWSAPRAIWRGSDIHLCEPGVVASPDGKTLALLLRENRRVKNAHVMFSDDKAATWSAPRELPSCLTGDRHIATYANDGRLVVSFRCMLRGHEWNGDWVAWVGTWDEIARSEPVATTARNDARTSYVVRLKDNLSEWDCAYPGLETLADGTLVATTYGTWNAGEQPSILSVRFTLAELDALVDAMTLR